MFAFTVVVAQRCTHKFTYVCELPQVLVVVSPTYLHPNTPGTVQKKSLGTFSYGHFRLKDCDYIPILAKGSSQGLLIVSSSLFINVLLFSLPAQRIRANLIYFHL